MTTNTTAPMDILLQQIEERITRLEEFFQADSLLNRSISPSRLLIDIYDITQAIEQLNFAIPSRFSKLRTFSELQLRLIYALKSQLASIYSEIYNVRRYTKS